MINALLIGCGNIGAFYDWETKDIRTYVRAFYSLGVKMSIYDPNHEKSVMVADRYGGRVLQRWDEFPPDSYDIVVVSSPTPTHFNYLKVLLSNPPRLIICEKPVDLDPDRLDKLKSLYNNNQAKVIVNFYRRFQPKMIDLAKRIEKINESDICHTIVIRYQRGFHNNASHAMDLLGFLFNKPFNTSQGVVLDAISDEFIDDPTMTVFYIWNGIRVLFVGLVDARYSHFEISMYFSKQAIELKQGGSVVEFFSTKEKIGEFYPALESREIWTDALRDHMKKIVEHAINIVNNSSQEDNFIESIEISKQIVSISEGFLK